MLSREEREFAKEIKLKSKNGMWIKSNGFTTYPWSDAEVKNYKEAIDQLYINIYPSSSWPQEKNNDTIN